MATPARPSFDPVPDEDPSIASVLDFWCGPLDEAGSAQPAYSKRWWMKDRGFDNEILELFLPLHTRLQMDGRSSTEDSPRGLLAAILVLDQLSRNMFRDTANMYAADALAQSLAFEGIALGFDEDAPAAYRTFFYMPLMHSERLVAQDRCVALFAKMASGATAGPKKMAEANQGYAVKHRDIVARFGRFPHRNQILGRPSTAEELAFLKEPGSSF